MATALLDRLPSSRGEVLLAVGDLAAIAIFVAAGEISHARPVLSGVGTFLAFVAGWAVVAPVLGAYGDRALTSIGRSVGLGAVAWLGAALIGQVVRAAVVPAANIAPTFVLVSILVGGILLGVWRGIAAMLLRSD
jgi:hypothetical protein